MAKRLCSFFKVYKPFWGWSLSTASTLSPSRPGPPKRSAAPWCRCSSHSAGPAEFRDGEESNFCLSNQRGWTDFWWDGYLRTNPICGLVNHEISWHLSWVYMVYSWIPSQTSFFQWTSGLSANRRTDLLSFDQLLKWSTVLQGAEAVARTTGGWGTFFPLQFLSVFV